MTAFDRLLAIMIKPWVVLSYAGLVILSFMVVDKPMAYYFYEFGFRERLHWLNGLTNLGIGAIYLVLFFLLALFFRCIYRNKVWEERSWFLWICVLIPNGFCLALKMIVGRARPDLLFHGQVYGFFGLHTGASFWSFPSGHTTTIMALVFGLSALFPRYCYALIVAGLLVASSRIVLTQHYLSDVLAASYLALLEVGLLLYWVRHKQVMQRSLPIAVPLKNCNA